jgi:hypothetical protein
MKTSRRVRLGGASRISTPGRGGLHRRSRRCALLRDWRRTAATGTTSPSRLPAFTRFHGGKDGHQPQLSPALGQEDFDQILFADELDFDPAFLSQPFRVFPQSIAVGPGEVDGHAGHAFGKTDSAGLHGSDR